MTDLADQNLKKHVAVVQSDPLTQTENRLQVKLTADGFYVSKLIRFVIFRSPDDFASYI